MDGNSPENAELYENLKKLGVKYHSQGELGVALSMSRVLRSAIANDYKSILWLEDDVVFHKDFPNLFDQKMRKFPEDWSVLFFGATIRKDAVKSLKSSAGAGFFETKNSFDGSFCLGVRKSAYAFMLYLLEKHIGVIDTAVLGEVCRSGFKCYMSSPFIATVDYRTTNIQNRDQSMFFIAFCC